MTTPGSHGPGEQPSSGIWGPPAGTQQPGAVPPPPPPGAFPQGAYPPPQGQFPQAQFPQGGYPPPQGSVAPGQGWTPPQPAQSGAAKWIGLVGGIVAIVLGIVAVFSFFGGDPEAGDCLRDDGSELASVDCDDDAAQYRLVGIQEGEQTQEEYLADPATCADFPTATQYFWVGDLTDPDSEGEVYCVTGV